MPLFLLLSSVCVSNSNNSDTTSPHLIERIHDQEFHPNPSRFTRIKLPAPNPRSIDDLASAANIVHNIQPLKDGVINLLIVVESLPSSRSWRDGVRHTWGRADVNGPQTNFIIVFVVPIEHHKVDKRLLEETTEYQDMILFKLVSPSTTSSVRLINYLYWCNQLLNFKLLLRTIDSYYIRVDQLIPSLSFYEPSDNLLLYMGYFKGNISIDTRRDQDWFVCPQLVPHADEGAYLLSNSLISKFLKHAKYLSYHPSEGASVGLWTSPFKNVKLVHNINFDSLQSRGCWHTLLTTRENSVEGMRSRHNRVYHGAGQFCDKEISISRNYKYNWDNPPSQCCNVFI